MTRPDLRNKADVIRELLEESRSLIDSIVGGDESASDDGRKVMLAELLVRAADEIAISAKRAA